MLLMTESSMPIQSCSFSTPLLASTKNSRESDSATCLLTAMLFLLSPFASQLPLSAKSNKRDTLV